MSSDREIRLAPLAGTVVLQALAEPDAARAGHVHQLRLSLTESLSEGTCTMAWQRTTMLHPALTSRFSLSVGRPPCRVEDPGLSAKVEIVGWDADTTADHEAKMVALLEQDRIKGLEPRQAPLCRLTLVRRNGDMAEALFTFHDALLDPHSTIQVAATFLDQCAEKGGRRPTRTFSPDAEVGTSDAEEDERGVSYFSGVYGTRDAPTPLPLASSIAVEGRGLFGELTFRLAELDALREQLRAVGVSWEVLIAGAWSVVLARCTGELDVVFGVEMPAGVRTERRAHGVVGVFHNAVPLAAKVTDQTPVRTFLSEVAEQLSRALDYRDVSLGEVARRSRLPAGAQLFETLLRFEDIDLEQTLAQLVGQASAAGLAPRLAERPPVPLLLATRVSGEHLSLRVVFEHSRLTSEQAGRLGSCFLVALRELVADPARPLADVGVLSQTERDKLLYRWNETDAAFPRDITVESLFERKAKSQPQQPAIRSTSGTVISYQQLDKLASRLAARLAASDIGPGKYVGVCLSRGPRLLVCLLGVAKSGAAYVPFDPGYSDEVLEDMCAQSDVSVVITEEALAGNFDREVLLATDVLTEDVPSVRPPSKVTPTSPLYAIFTSGSTGRPKGVVVGHRAVTNTLDWVNKTFAVGVADRVLYANSPCFDLSVYDLFGLLAAGGTIVVPTDEELKDPAAVAELIVRENITIWNSAPAALGRVVPFLPENHASKALRLILLSGDFTPLSLPPQLRQRFASARIINLGGATEAAIWSNFYEVEELEEEWTSIPYGRPTQNARYYALDHRMEPLPVGAPGELYIGGECVAAGYLNRPELTEERFVADPFGASTTSRLYRTGDLVRYFEDGNLELLGRTDFQVKIRGFRVELPAIDTVIGALPNVRSALCMAHPDASGEKSLIAYVVPTSPGLLTAGAIKQHVGRSLPPFMVPSQVLFLDELPLGSTGKPDRKQLPAPGRQISASPLAVEDALEDWIAHCFLKLLEVPDVGLDDDFFDLGGHSLLAVMLISRIYESLGAQVTLPVLLANSSVRQLAEVVRRSIGAIPASRHIQSFHPEGVKPPLLLAPGTIGTAFTFRSLPEFLGPQQPIHVVDLLQMPPGLDRIEGIAELVFEEVSEKIGKKPTVVGGFSFGAALAYEMAMRLTARGQLVPLIIAFDGCAPGYRPSQGSSLIAGAKKLLSQEKQRSKAYLKRGVRTMGRVFQAFEGEPRSERAGELKKRIDAIGRDQRKALGSYRPSESLPSAVLLFRAEDASHLPGSEVDELLGWGSRVSGPISVVSLPGRHLELFSDRNMNAIADAVREHLQRHLGEFSPVSSRGRTRSRR